MRFCTETPPTQKKERRRGEKKLPRNRRMERGLKNKLGGESHFQGMNDRKDAAYSWGSKEEMWTNRENEEMRYRSRIQIKLRSKMCSILTRIAVILCPVHRTGKRVGGWWGGRPSSTPCLLEAERETHDTAIKFRGQKRGRPGLEGGRS